MGAFHTAHAEAQDALREAADFAPDAEVREWCLAYDLLRPKMPDQKVTLRFVDGLLKRVWPGRTPSRAVEDVEAAEAKLTDLISKLAWQ